MGRLISVYMVIPVIFIMWVYVSLVNNINSEDITLADMHLKIAVNNASDSAIEELLKASDLGMDYADWGKFRADPDLALNDFVDTFLLNYNMPLTEYNRNLVKTKYIQVFCVASYDGYYIYDHRKKYEDGGADLVSSPKLPYLYKDESIPGRNVTYALNMGFSRCYKLTDATITRAKSPVDKATTLKIINTRISDDMRQRVDKAHENGMIDSIYIPTGLTTISRTNPIESPTIIAYVDNVDLDSVQKLSAFGIGGSRAKIARPVSAYQRKNTETGEWTKYYAYSDLLPGNISEDNTIIENVFMSVEDAASQGYWSDPLYVK